MPILPPLPDSFHWTAESWGDGLRCRPLEAIAPHVFTTRQLELSDRDGYQRLAESLHARHVATVAQVHGSAVSLIRGGTPRGGGWPFDARHAAPEGDVLVSDDPE